jgi:TRAP-type C4-dicarboxylate transport system permease small subunit
MVGPGLSFPEFRIKADQQDLMKKLEQITARLNGLLARVAGFFLVAMAALTCANILLRLVWAPIPGTFELMGFFGAVTAALALGFTQIRRGHIAVDVLIMTFSKKKRRALYVVNSLLGALFGGLCAWQLAAIAFNLDRTGEVTETLGIAYYPFVHAVAAGFAVLALVFVADLIRALLGKKEDWS